MNYYLKLLANPEGVHQRYLRKAVMQSFACWDVGTFALALDFGCGQRPYKEYIERVAMHCVAVDIGENACADLLIQPDSKLPFASGSIDLITSFQVLEHVEQYDAYLSECARLCKIGGSLLISAPFVWPFHPHPSDMRRWTEQGLKYDLLKCGFKIEAVRPVLNPIASAMQYALSVFYYMSMNRGRRREILMKCLALWFNPQILLCERLFRSSGRYGSGCYVIKAQRFEP